MCHLQDQFLTKRVPEGERADQGIRQVLGVFFQDNLLFIQLSSFHHDSLSTVPPRIFFSGRYNFHLLCETTYSCTTSCLLLKYYRSDCVVLPTPCCLSTVLPLPTPSAATVCLPIPCIATPASALPATHHRATPTKTSSPFPYKDLYKVKYSIVSGNSPTRLAH